MAFHLGSLGFLSPFDFSDYKEQVSRILEGETWLHIDQDTWYIDQDTWYIDQDIRFVSMQLLPWTIV